jgi:hypothetical protein
MSNTERSIGVNLQSPQCPKLISPKMAAGIQQLRPFIRNGECPFRIKSYIARVSLLRGFEKREHSSRFGSHSGNLAQQMNAPETMIVNLFLVLMFLGVTSPLVALLSTVLFYKDHRDRVESERRVCNFCDAS